MMNDTPRRKRKLIENIGKTQQTTTDNDNIINDKEKEYEGQKIAQGLEDSINLINQEIDKADDNYKELLA